MSGKATTRVFLSFFLFFPQCSCTNIQFIVILADDDDDRSSVIPSTKGPRREILGKENSMIGGWDLMGV